MIHIWQDEWVYKRNEIQQKLKNIILGKHVQQFKDNILILDRSWYSYKQEINGYKLVEILLPEIIQREEFLVENCGYLKYIKINE